MMSPSNSKTRNVRDVERDWMARASSGDIEAFGELFESCYPRIFRMAYAILHDRAAADDVAQETFLKAFDKISSYRGESAPRAWLSSIALNVCRHRLRAGKHTEGGVTDRALESGRRLFRPRTRAGASKAVEHENLRLLVLALGFLTEAQREVFLLHYEQDLSYEEIGQILGLGSGTARALAHRAKASLRARLGSQAWIAKNVSLAD